MPKCVKFCNLTPAGYALAGVFAVFAVDNPVDIVDNSIYISPHFSLIFSVYVN